MQNEMRDRLVELLKQVNFDFSEECVACCEDGYKAMPMLEDFFADHLIENGVIVPPCKVGDTVYFIENEQVRCGEVVEIRRYKDPEVISENSPIQEIYYVNSAVICFPMGCSELTPYTRDDFGKIVFHTKEAAEKALKEGADNKR